MLTHRNEFTVLVSSDPEFDDLVAEVDFEGEFFCLISQDQGIEDLRLQIAPRKDALPWDMPVDDLLHIIDTARRRLWELRKK